MPTETVLALGLTLVSAVAINWGYLLEHRAASGLPPLSVRHPLRTVRVLLGSRAWLFGFLLETSGFILYVLALALAPLALVQSVAAGGIGVLAVLVARISRTRLEPRERVGVGIAIGGLALLAISLAGGSGQGVAGTWYAIGLWLAVSVGAAVAVATFGARPLPGGAAFGLAAGILFAAGDIATKAVVSGGNHLLLGPAMIGFYAGGTMVLQSGFQRGRALTTAGIATLATNAIPIAAAMTLFREPLPSGVLGVTRVAAFASVVIGAVWLSPKRPDTPADEPSTELPAGEPDMADEDGIQVDARDRTCTVPCDSLPALPAIQAERGTARKGDAMADSGNGSLFHGIGAMLDDLEDFYKDIHRHPELSMQEERTAGLAAERLGRAGFEVTTGVGKTGVVGLLRNGDGPTVMLRADMDALPVQEETGLDYASETDGVMHACGHDMHVAWLSGAAALLAADRGSWNGTLMSVFQPAEETAAGARAMIDDGLFDRFPKPDVVLGQHVMPSRAGSIGTRSGVMTSSADSLEIRMFGRGAHGSMPEASIDPVVMAAATVMRLQTIVSREIAAAQSAIVTIGSLQAGTKENVIPDEGVIRLNVRTFDEDVRTHVLDAIHRIVEAEAQASRAPKPPEITPLDQYQLVRNDPEAATTVRTAFQAQFGNERVVDIPPLSASEDFGSFGSEWHSPSVFWTVGGTDADTYDRAREEGRLLELPTNHNPRFAPVIHPTLEIGVQTLLAAAGAWLAPPAAD